jgi:photosystem II stability/assembly factor-like uncharacterized protein
LFRSADHGNSWQPLGEGVLVDTLESVAIDSDGSLFAITHSLLYRSTDDGNSWAAVKGLPRLLFHILATNSDNLFVGSYGNGLFLTTDKGLSWKKISDFSRIYSLAMDRDGFIYAAANDHLFRTSKSTYVSGSGGAIWADWSARVLLSMPPAPTE